LSLLKIIKKDIKLKKPLHLERRHFEFIADTINQSFFEIKNRETAAFLFGHALSKTNDKFNYVKFISRAIGKTTKTIKKKALRKYISRFNNLAKE
jgi:hypothetical protein